MAEPDWPALAARARKGDRAAFERIVQGTARLVYAQVVVAVRDRQKAEDLTQETFVAAWKAIEGGQLRDPAGGDLEGKALIAWLLTIARNVTLDAAKFDGRRKRGGSWGARMRFTGEAGHAPALETVAGAAKGSGEVVEDVRDGGMSPAASAELKEAREEALRVLEELPEEYRRVLQMRYLAGADYETIRRALGLSDGALRGLLCRGMALMRERMSRQDGDRVTR